MKKFDIKKLMILMLALLLVFALVACDKGGEGSDRPIVVPPDDDPEIQAGNIRAAEYFQDLWKASASLGSGSFAATDDVTLNADLNVKLAIDGGAIVDLGINLGIVYDRASVAYTYSQNETGKWGKVGSDYHWIKGGYRAYNATTDTEATRFARSTSSDGKTYEYAEAADGAYVYDEYCISNAGDKGDDVFVAVADRYVYTTADKTVGTKSAAKIKLYDHNNSDNWLTLYYFLNDPYSAYVDFKGEQIKVSFDTGFNDNYKAVVAQFIDATGLLGDTTVADIIDLLFDKGGDNVWSLDDLVFGIVGLFGLDLNSLLAKVAPIIGVDVEDIQLSGGSASLLPVLETAGAMLFPFDKKSGTSACTKTDREGGGYIYTGKVAGKFPALLKDTTGGLLTSSTDLRLIFGVDAQGAIDGFKITAAIPKSVAGKKLELEIGINDITFGKLENKTSEAALGCTKTNYKENFELDLNLSVGIVGNALVINPDSKIDTDGYYELSLKGFVDLANQGAANKTVAYATLKYGATKAAAATVAEASYSPMTETGFTQYGQLVLKVNNSVKFNDTTDRSLVDAFAENIGPMIVKALAKSDDTVVSTAGIMLANALYTEVFADKAAVESSETYTYDSNFTGVVLQQIDLTKLFTGLFKGEPSYEAPSASEAEAAAYSKWTVNIKNIVKTVVGALSNKDGVITLSVEDASAVIFGVFGGVPASVDEMLFGNTDNTVDGWFGNDGTPNKTDGWWSDFFAGSAWAVAENEKATISGLLSSDATVTINNVASANGVYPDKKGEITVGVKNGNASVDLALLINIKALDAINTYTVVAKPTGANFKPYAADVYVSGGTQEAPTFAIATQYDGVQTDVDGNVWAMLTVNQDNTKGHVVVVAAPQA